MVWTLVSPRGGSKLKTTLHKCIMANGWQYYINHIGKKRTNGCSVKSMVYRGFLGPNGYFKRKKLSPPPPGWVPKIPDWMTWNTVNWSYLRILIMKLQRRYYLFLPFRIPIWLIEFSRKRLTKNSLAGTNFISLPARRCP